MSALNAICLAGAPAGVSKEGIIDGTPKPGTCMQIKAATAAVGGRHTWQVFNSDADGDQRLVVVLLNNWALGRGPDEAYVSGERGFLYCPLPGDELLMLVANISGTSDAFAIGDLLMIDDGTGKLVATTGSPEMESFIVMETVAAITADTLIHVMYTGH